MTAVSTSLTDETRVPSGSVIRMRLGAMSLRTIHGRQPSVGRAQMPAGRLGILLPLGLTSIVGLKANVGYSLHNGDTDSLPEGFWRRGGSRSDARPHFA